MINKTSKAVATSSIIHGLWMLFPHWGWGSLGAPRVVELVVAAMLMTGGTYTLLWLNRIGTFSLFISWVFLAAAAMAASGAYNIGWVTYATVASVSAFMYLGGGHGDD